MIPRNTRGDSYGEFFIAADHSVLKLFTGLAAAALMKNGVLLSENALITYCNLNVNYYTEGYDPFSAIMVLSSTDVKAGQEMETRVGIDAFQRDVGQKITINGITVPPGDEGTAVYRFPARGRPGKYSIPVEVEYLARDRHRIWITKKLEYMIGE